jgi:hypothetical protein
MITRVQLLRNVGQFASVDAGATIILNQCVLVYAENGRGKSTLTAILRSLSSGDPLPISERRRLAAQNPPHVVLQCSDATVPAVFENSVWSRTFPDMLIFDERFVDENLYSGLNVDAGHRQNLHELVLGAQGVALNRCLQEIVARIEQHNTALRIRAEAIPTGIRGTLSVDDFCVLPRVAFIDDQIQVAERNLAAAVAQDSVRATPTFDALVIPPIEIASITEVLRRDLQGLDSAAVGRVQEHLSKLGRGAEAWVADGMRRIARAEGGSEVCPFCAQGLTDSTVIDHYRAYFSEEYGRLKSGISDAIAEIDRLHGESIRTGFERAVRIAIERRQFWSRLCDVPEIVLDTEALARDWRESVVGVAAVLLAKQAAPLERFDVPKEVRAAIERFEDRRTLVTDLSQRLQQANQGVRAVKDGAAAVSPQSLVGDLRALNVIRARYTPDVDQLCEEYLNEVSAKSAT